MIVLKLFTVILRYSLRKPERSGQTGIGIRDNSVRKSPDNIIALFFFISEPLKIERRKFPVKFHCSLHRDYMSKLMRYDVSEPIMRAPHVVIHRQCPDDDLIIIEIGCAVRDVVCVLNDESDRIFGFMIVEFGYRSINFFGYLRHSLRGIFKPFMIGNGEMLRFYRLPLQFRMIISWLGIQRT